jgi:hypothetical protein
MAGARSDLVSLRSTSLRFQTVWDNQTRLRKSLEGITCDLILHPEHQRVLEQGALLTRGRVPHDMKAAIQALRKLSKDCHHNVPPPLQSMQAVQGQLRALKRLQFTFSRRVLALCKSRMAAAVSNLPTGQGGKSGAGSSKGGTEGARLPLSGVHAELESAVPLIEAVVDVDVRAQDVLEGLYVKALGPGLQLGLSLLLQDVHKHISRTGAKESRLLHLPDAGSEEARAYLAQSGAASGRQALCRLLAALKPALLAEEAFVARWLGLATGLGQSVDGDGGKEEAKARGRAAERVLLQALGAQLARVLDMPEAVLKHDALAAPAMLAHLAAAARHEEEEEGAGVGGQVWRRVLYELRVKVRGRLWHHLEVQLEAISQAPHGSAKKVPAWVSKVGTLVQALLASHATPAAPDSPAAAAGGPCKTPPIPRRRGREEGGLGEHDAREEAGLLGGSGKAGGATKTLMDGMCEKILTAALRSLGGQAAGDPKYGSRLMLRA